VNGRKKKDEESGEDGDARHEGDEKSGKKNLERVKRW